MRMFEVTKSGADHYILGPVLIPDVVDGQGDIVSAAEIEKACAFYNANSRRIFKDHKSPMSTRDAELIESYVSPAAMVIGDGHRVPAGSWIVKIRVSEEIYRRAQHGGIFGFSIAGRGNVEHV